MTTEDQERRSGVVNAGRGLDYETSRDRSRVLYSDAFRRLAGVTQVAIGRPDRLLHNRLTHSLKVEDTGVVIQQLIADERTNRDAIAAACLAHDIGHPPFGHAGETELNAILTCATHRRAARPYAVRLESPCKDCKLEDGFEGNAQSFRILTQLEDSRVGYGLDLTFRTLRAVTKYPWLRGDNKSKSHKWGAYDCDANLLWETVRVDQSQTDAIPVAPTLDAQIMDWADDISYAVHDLEDFYRSGHIPFSSYRANSETLANFLEYASRYFGELSEQAIEAFTNLTALFPEAVFDGSHYQRIALISFRSILMTTFLESTSIVGETVHVERITREVNGLLKSLIWYHVIDAPTLTGIQAGQRQAIRELFNYYEGVALEAFRVDEGGAPDMQLVRRLPRELQTTIEITRSQESAAYRRRECIYRGLADFIASLGDEEAYAKYEVLKGEAAAGRI